MFDDQFLAAAEPAPPPSAPPPADGSGNQRALYLRWRPQKFEDVVGQEHVTRTLRNAVVAGRLAHAYLFTGPRGTGKTSAARILYRAANCPNAVDGDPCNACPLCEAAQAGRAMDLVEIDAASNRGIDDIRDLRDRVAFRPSAGRYRVYIIDEAHELTPAAWDAFLKTLEEPPPHVIFVLATTESHKVPATILSRCQRFDFRRIPFNAIRDQLARVAEAEGLQVDDDVLERIGRTARGGLRDALSLLDQLSASGGSHVDISIARAVLGLPSTEIVHAAIDALANRDAAALMSSLQEVAEGSADYRQFTEEMVASLRAVLLLRNGAGAALNLDFPEEEIRWLTSRAEGFAVGQLLTVLRDLSTALIRTRDAQQFQVQVELSLLELCQGAAMRTSGGAPAPLPAAAPSRQVLDGPSPSGYTVAQPERDRALPGAASPREQGAANGTAAGDEPGVESPPPAPALPPTDEVGMARRAWPDVVEYVSRKKPMVASVLSNAEPVSAAEGVLTICVGTEFNRKRVEMKANREDIEEGVRRALGGTYRVEFVVGGAAGSSAAELTDPVLSYAIRTFGGRARRLGDEGQAQAT